MIGQLVGRPAGERLYGSIALATIAVWQGASIVRAHDVGATAEALKICQAIKRAAP
jgi:dihydropteroate synthase